LKIPVTGSITDSLKNSESFEQRKTMIGPSARPWLRRPVVKA
jgi:hypothetical protein